MPPSDRPPPRDPQWPRQQLLAGIGPSASSAAELDVPGCHGPGGSAGCPVVAPVHIRVGDDLGLRRGSPLGQVLGGVGVADQGRVIAPD